MRMDKHGRIYLPRSVKRAAGIEGQAVLEATASKGRIVLTVREAGVARGARGIFRLREHVKDVDEEIRRASLRATVGELDEIRRR